MITICYLYHWCDSDEICNRWLVFQISDKQLKDYIKQNLTLYEMIVNPAEGEIFVVDIDGQGNHISVWLTQPANLPYDYLPSKGTLFDSSVSAFYEQEICSESFAYLLDEIQDLRQRIIRNSVDQSKITFTVVTEPIPEYA